jgi:hypothetical protein
MLGFLPLRFPLILTVADDPVFPILSLFLLSALVAFLTFFAAITHCCQLHFP